MLSSLNSFASEDCGVPGTITVKTEDGKHKVSAPTRVFKDGSIAVRARLAVNPDGGPASYTVGDHGFTYIANGVSKWRDDSEVQCTTKENCGTLFKEAEEKGFGPGTTTFCSFALKVESYALGQPTVSCGEGKSVIGGGLGKPATGDLLDTTSGDKVQSYLSTTSLRHLVKGKEQYLNSENLPLAVTPDKKLLGKLIWVTGENLTPTFALIADKGPAFGEGSIALHQLLRYNKLVPQKPGPIPVAQRCSPIEVLRAPFASHPDDKDDVCGKAGTRTTASDIRAYRGFSNKLDFIILGKSPLKMSGRVVQSEVTEAAIREAGSQYSTKELRRKLACLDN